MLSGQSVSSGTAASIVVNTHKGNAAGLSSMASSPFATINQRMQAKIPTPLKVQVQAVSISTSLCSYLACFFALKLNCFKNIIIICLKIIDNYCLLLINLFVVRMFLQLVYQQQECYRLRQDRQAAL